MEMFDIWQDFFTGCCVFSDVLSIFLEVPSSFAEIIHRMSIAAERYEGCQRFYGYFKLLPPSRKGANASIHATRPRPDRQYAANKTNQTFMAGTYAKTGERGWGRRAIVC